MIKQITVLPYGHESCLPCELKEIVGKVFRKKIDLIKDTKLGLSKDIRAIPLNNGYIISTKELILYVDNLEPLFQIDGTHKLGQLYDDSPHMRSNIQQLHYYDLLAFNCHPGSLQVFDIDPSYAERYRDGAFVTFSLVPFTVELDITNSCNFNCIHCCRDANTQIARHTEKQLSIEELFGVIEQCAQIGVSELLLMGGEPLVYKGFFDLVQYALDLGIHDVRTSTNGWLVTEDIALRLAEYFNNIQVSVHGATSMVHDAIVKKKGAWEQARHAVSVLRQKNIKVNISFTVMRENADDIKRMPYLAKEWGADSLRYIRLTQQGRGLRLNAWSEEEVIQIGNEIKAIYENLPFDLGLDAGGFQPLRPTANDACFYGCSAGKTLMAITSDGKVKSCASLDEDIGDIRKNKILDIWHSANLVNSRKQLDCQDCNFVSVCWGSCKVKC